jgi:RNA polymerase sigma-70 factor (ECF subfamily)
MIDQKARQHIKELYERYGSLVYRRCRFLLRSEDDAWDATQELFVKLMNQIEAIDKIESLTAWLLRASTNHCLSQLRRKKSVEFNEEFHVPEQEADGQEKTVILADLVKQFLAPWDEKIREILVYTYVDGYTQQEISQMTGMGESTIRKHLTRFRRQVPLQSERYKEAFYE